MQLGSHRSGSAGLARPRCEKHFPKIKQNPAPINTPKCALAELHQGEAGNCFSDRPWSKVPYTAAMISPKQSSPWEFNFKPFPSTWSRFRAVDLSPLPKGSLQTTSTPCSKWWVSSWPLPGPKQEKVGGSRLTLISVPHDAVWAEFTSLHCQFCIFIVILGLEPLSQTHIHVWCWGFRIVLKLAVNEVDCFTSLSLSYPSQQASL